MPAVSAPVLDVQEEPQSWMAPGRPGLGFFDGKSAPQSSCKAFSRVGHGAGSPSPVFGFVAARWAQPLACPQFGWPHTPERDRRAPFGMDGDALGWGGIAPLRCTASPTSSPTGTFGVPGRVWHHAAHLDGFRVLPSQVGFPSGPTRAEPCGAVHCHDNPAQK